MPKTLGGPFTAGLGVDVMLNPTIQHEIWIAAPLDRVWKAISATDQIARWWGGNGLVRVSDLRVGSTIDFTTSDGVISATIRQVEPPNLLVYEWPPHPRYFMVPFVTSYTLTQQNGGVLLKFVESGFSAWPDDAARRERYERLREGFGNLFSRLKHVLEDELGAQM
jgi:uncharacterized protein YndB with AHSA1/START domain